MCIKASILYFNSHFFQVETLFSFFFFFLVFSSLITALTSSQIKLEGEGQGRRRNSSHECISNFNQNVSMACL